MQPMLALIIVWAVLALSAFLFYCRKERQRFIQQEKGQSWLAVRIASIPITIIGAMLVWLPAKATSGMEGLAVFYIMLLIAFPLFWFGSHWIVGRFTQPPLTLGESATIAGSPILFAIGAAYLAQALQTPAWQLLRSMGWM